MSSSTLTKPQSGSMVGTNIADRLDETVQAMPSATAIVTQRRLRDGSYRYDSTSFQDLASDVARLAGGLQQIGVTPGKRMVLMVRPSADFVALTFALFKVGAVTVLIDPGMGRENLLDCLEAVRPDGFVAIPLAHAARVVHRKRFPQAQLNVTVGRRWFWGGTTIAQLRRQAGSFQHVALNTNDAAAIIFTTGSTGPPKGVLYSHGNFDAQVTQIRDHYGIEPGGVDLAGFPLFGLFNGAMGTTTVIPDMDASRPASVDPQNIVHAINHLSCTQAFASPAVWNVVGRYCEERKTKLPSLSRVLAAGAPVPTHVLRRMMAAIHPEGDVHTPYGATESLPIASIAASQLLAETAKAKAGGAGTCVGSRFSQAEWRVIRISDEPIPTIDDVESVPAGAMGELIVRGPQVTRQYVTREDQNALHKIQDGDSCWHRVGDVGYLDELDRFWFCGRKGHRVVTERETMFTIPCEAIANEHPAIYRSALVGVNEPGRQTPVMVCEPWPEHWTDDPAAQDRLKREIAGCLSQHELTSQIQPCHILLRKALPVDIRHNAKIFREQLSVWAAEQL